MSESDDDYPELDISDQYIDPLGIVVGPPPASYTETDREETPMQNRTEDDTNSYGNSSGEHDYDSYLDSGDDDFDVDAYYANDNMDEPPPETIPDNLIQNVIGRNDNADYDFSDASNPEIMKLFLSSSLLSNPLKFRSGYSSDELDDCLKSCMGYSLQVTAVLLLPPEIISQLPNDSKTEHAHALVRGGWLQSKEGAFFPVISDSERETVVSLMNGSEEQHKRQERKKKEADTFESEEKEIRTLLTFNMIAELLMAVRNEYSIRSVKYQILSTAYTNMVTGAAHANIFRKYKDILQLDPEKLWNNDWFKEYTNRGTLKKFLTTARFSEIVVSQANGKTVELYFRADDEGNRPVVLFTDEHIADVRNKWKTGNQRNQNYGSQGNYRAGGQRSDDRRGPQQRRNVIVPDPNYQPSTFAGGISNNADDDGSLQPTTSSHFNRNTDRSTSRPPRAPTSPVNRVMETDPLMGQGTSSGAPQRSAIPNPFGGAPALSRSTITNGNRGPSYGDRGERVQDVGDTTSDSEITSEGSYSDEDPEQKEIKRQRRKDKLKKKQERELRSREKHTKSKQQPPSKIETRFNTYKKKSESSATDTSNTPPVDTVNVALPTPVVESSSTTAAPSIPVSTRPEVVVPPENPAPLREVGNFYSKSNHDEDRRNVQLPFTPADTHKPIKVAPKEPVRNPLLKERPSANGFINRRLPSHPAPPPVNQSQPANQPMQTAVYQNSHPGAPYIPQQPTYQPQLPVQQPQPHQYAPQPIHHQQPIHQPMHGQQYPPVNQQQPIYQQPAPQYPPYNSIQNNPQHGPSPFNYSQVPQPAYNHVGQQPSHMSNQPHINQNGYQNSYNPNQGPTSSDPNYGCNPQFNHYGSRSVYHEDHSSQRRRSPDQFPPNPPEYDPHGNFKLADYERDRMTVGYSQNPHQFDHHGSHMPHQSQPQGYDNFNGNSAPYFNKNGGQSNHQPEAQRSFSVLSSNRQPSNRELIFQDGIEKELRDIILRYRSMNLTVLTVQELRTEVSRRPAIPRYIDIVQYIRDSSSVAIVERGDIEPYVVLKDDIRN
ncbi:MUTator [Caenorhabditis elegans]|uniref:MUTator n=1 Tax=Caenorhabditis elegans TaxID=6239 RepID=Q9U3S5_CAEEL|nr:MUTator [Caenorhabditis elegans]CAB54187.3 MUTator [Caenorhabditis elegans]|eukprot:NP_492661.3 MUTator [Caenorhabditis elegans]